MTDLILKRRGFLIGAATLLAAPAIVRVGNIMPVHVPLRDFHKMWHATADFYPNDLWFGFTTNGWLVHPTNAEKRAIKNGTYKWREINTYRNSFGGSTVYANIGRDSHTDGDDVYKILSGNS